MARSQKNQPKEKLSQKEKQKLKKEGEKMRQQLKTIVYPTLGVVFILIVIYVYLRTKAISIQKASDL